MATIPETPISSVYVDATLTDTLGIVTAVTSLKVESNSSVVGSSRIHLANGDNTITVPTGSRGVIITFHETCDSLKTLKGAAGDTGIRIASTLLNARNSGTMMLLFGASPPASFIINSVGVDVGYTEFQFF